MGAQDIRGWSDRAEESGGAEGGMFEGLLCLSMSFYEPRRYESKEGAEPHGQDI